MRLVGQNSVARIKRRSSLGQIILTLLSVIVLFLAAFTAIEVPIASQRNISAFTFNKVQIAVDYLPASAQSRVKGFFPALNQPRPAYRTTFYSPLAPAAVFVGYVLGPIQGLLACLAFLILGLIGPYVGIHPFANGGGLGYLHEPGFGYLLALMPTAWVSGMITRGRRTTVSQSLAVLAGLTVTHLTGLMFLFGSVLVSYLVNGNSAALAWQPWVFELARNMTWYPVPYDILSALALIGLGFPFRWLSNTLVAPDSASKAPVPVREREFVTVDAFDEYERSLV